MRRTVGILVTSVVAVAAMVGGPHARAAETAPAVSTVRAALGQAATAHGIAPETVFAAITPVTVTDFDGTVTTHNVRFGDFVDALGGGGTHAAAQALPLPVEVNAGMVLHVYASAGSGNQLRYSVSTSAVAPSTPPVIVPLPAPYNLAYDPGGPLTQVKGSGWNVLGFHTAGSWGAGNNVDTADPGNGDPIYIPGRSSNFAVDDTSLDFVGHALTVQSQFCFFGVCFSAGGMLANGATLFNSQLPVGISTLP